MALVLTIASQSLLYFDKKRIMLCSYQFTARMIIILSETACPQEN